MKNVNPFFLYGFQNYVSFLSIPLKIWRGYNPPTLVSVCSDHVSTVLNTAKKGAVPTVPIDKEHLVSQVEKRDYESVLHAQRHSA